MVLRQFFESAPILRIGLILVLVGCNHALQGESNAKSEAHAPELAPLPLSDEERAALQATEKLLAGGGDPNAIEPGQEATPLMVAAMQGYANVAALLLKHGAKVDGHSDASTVAPLHLAAGSGHADIVRLLLDHGAKVDARGGRASRSPLFGAAGYGRIDAAQALLAGKADANVKDATGVTPLHIAAAGLQKDMVQLFLDHHADIQARDNEGETPLHWAAESRAADDVTIDIPAGDEDQMAKTMADLDARAPGVQMNFSQVVKNGKALMRLSAQIPRDNLEVVKLLVEKGAEVSAKDQSGRTAADAAALAGNTKAAEWLKAKAP